MARSFRKFCCCITGGFGIARNGDFNILAYRDFLSSAKTGDILLFEGNGIFSSCVQCVSQIRYSHIGMIIRIRDENTKHEEIFIWESTIPDNTYDFLTHTDKDGPRLVLADEKICQYAKNNYSITYRPMKINDARVINDISSGMVDLYMWAVMLLMSKVLYERDVFELSNAHLRIITGIKGHGGGIYEEIYNRSSVFCSELLAYTYRNGLGLSLNDISIGDDWQPEDFSPEDFAEDSEGLPFTKEIHAETIPYELLRPPQITYGPQYIVASHGNIDDLLEKRYSSFKGIKRRYHISQKNKNRSFKNKYNKSSGNSRRRKKNNRRRSISLGYHDMVFNEEGMGGDLELSELSTPDYSLKGEIINMFKEGMPSVYKSLRNHVRHIHDRDVDGSIDKMDNLPTMRLTFVFRTV